MSQPRLIPRIFDEEKGAGEAKGELARLAAFNGAIAVADIVKSTLGPRGMDKILQPMTDRGKVSFTNDGATILKSLPNVNPAAKIIIDTSKTQDEEVGDGTTSVAVLAGELLREAQKLVLQNIHPQTIIRGWRKALVVARDALSKSARDNSEDPEAFREDLYNVACTTLSSKILSSCKDHFANLAVDAVLRLKGDVDLENIHLIKKVGGNLTDSYLDDGFILDKKIGVGQPKRLENARVLVANTRLDADKIKIHGGQVRVSSVSKLADIEKAERQKMRLKVNKILDHKMNCFISRQLIYNFPEQMFTKAGVLSIEHADFEGVERLARVLGAEITSSFDHPEMVQLGACELIEEVQIGEDRLIRFSGVSKGEACTIVLRGASDHIIDEAERSLHDALCILTQTTTHKKIVYGGGCCEMLMAKAVDELANTTHGKEAIAMESFAKALRQIPIIIADNAGYDSYEVVSQLKAAHHEGKVASGLDMDRGVVGDMEALKITEALRSKMQVLISAAEAAEQILRVDELIQTAQRQRTQDHGH